MSENRDPAIKLFGKTIPLHSLRDPPPLEEKDIGNKGTSESMDHESLDPQEKMEPPKSMSSESSEQSSMDRYDGSVDDPATEEQPDDSNNSKQKTLKKPDKILPCPRCKSMDTKFCYYNNYDTNQPRHFCKNCQRYWTAGGTMRNVPVGSGRRKNKNLASHYRHLVVTTNPSFQAVRSAISDLVPYTLKAANDTVLSLGSDMPLPGSVPSLLTFSKKNTKICNRNGFHHQTEDKAAPPCCSTENGDDHSCSSNSEGAGTKNSTPIKNNAVQDFATVPRLDGSPWTYSWILSPPLCASSFPVPLYSVAAAYWSCPVPPGTFSVPWMSSPPTSFPVKSCPQGAAPVPISPTLAKRSRDKDALADGTVLKKAASRKHYSHERCIWTSKALRVDDLEEIAKSSIRTMIGCKNGKVDAVSDGCLLKLFHPSDNMTNRAVRPSQLLHPNPAPVSRSLNFQESS